MLGQIEFENYENLAKTMPQKAASAWSGAEIDKLVGAKYIPIAYIGNQPVRGTNHWFVAQMTLFTANPEKRIVTLAINEFNGVFTLIPTSINGINFTV